MRVASLVILLVYALAVARVTRLLNEDVLLVGPRERIVAWAWARRYGTEPTLEEHPRPFWVLVRRNGGIEPKLAYLITCPWCASIYVGAVAAPLWYWLGTSPWLLVPAAALAFSYITGFLAQHHGE